MKKTFAVVIAIVMIIVAGIVAVQAGFIPGSL